jgi:putative ABC transport system permease protein
MIAAVQLAEYLVLGLLAAGAGLTIGWLGAPLLFHPSVGFIAGLAPWPPLRVVAAATGLALAIAAAATVAPLVRAAAPPRRRGGRVRLSRRLPTAQLIGVRLNARRPRRARLGTINALVTTTTLAAAAANLAQTSRPLDLGGTTLANARDERTVHAILLVFAATCLLALLNTLVSTWTAVLDTRLPLAVARTLGATPGQAAAGLVLAQLLPAVPGAAAGAFLGRELHLFFAPGNANPAPVTWLLATGAAVLVAVAALTAGPALAAARHPVTTTLRAVPA